MRKVKEEKERRAFSFREAEIVRDEHRWKKKEEKAMCV